MKSGRHSIPLVTLVAIVTVSWSWQPFTGAGAAEHFDMSNAHPLSSFTPTNTISTSGNKGVGGPHHHHHGSSNNLVSRSGNALVQNVAQNRGSYGTDLNQGYNQNGVTAQNTGVAGGVAVGQVVTGSASSISSYGVPATGPGYGGGIGNNGNPSQTYYYYHYPAPGSMGVGVGWGDMSGGDDDDSLKGLTGLAGLLGLKGLKGLALLKLLKPLLLLSLLALPLLLLPLLFLLLFIPIPVITMTPGQNGGRSTGLLGENVLSHLPIFHQVLNDSQCVERIACELSQKTSRGDWIDNFITTIYNRTENYLPKIWIRGLRTYMDSSGSLADENLIKCAKFNCKEFSIWNSWHSNNQDEQNLVEMKNEPNSLISNLIMGKQLRNETVSKFD